MAGDETTRKVIQILIKKFKRAGGGSAAARQLLG